jgi:uncharacterized protein
MTMIGTLESVWRYPVKSMGGESLEEVFVAFSGLMGDRLYSLVSSNGNPGFPWHTARDQKSLLRYKPRYRNASLTLKPENLEAAQRLSPGVNPLYPEAEKFSIEVETPEGEVYSLDEEAFLEHIKTLTNNRTIKLYFTQKSQFDCRPLSLFSLQLRDLLAEELDTRIDKRRFRANFYVNWNKDKPPLYENELIGKRLKIGKMLEINVLERDPRCKMITLDPDTAEANPEIIKHVSRFYEGHAGVYGSVLVEGVVKAGDAIQLLD